MNYWDKINKAKVFYAPKMSKKEHKKHNKFHRMNSGASDKINQFLGTKSVFVKDPTNHIEVITAAREHLNFYHSLMDLNTPRRIHKAYCALMLHIKTLQPDFVFIFQGATKKPSKPVPAKQPTQDRIDRFYGSYEWRKLRYTILQKYGFKCLACGRSPTEQAVMHVDHIKPLRKNWHLRLDAENLQVLCDWCNHGKGNWDETDYRPPE